MSKGTTKRTIRVEDDLWCAAQQEAAINGGNLSQIIRDALSEYIHAPYEAVEIAAREARPASQAEKIRAAKAEAWDEGFQDGLRQDAEGADGPRFINPYRSEPESFANRMAARSLKAVTHESWKAKQ